MKLIMTGVILCILLIVLKFTVWDELNRSNELIPDVTDDEIFIRINDTHPLHEFIMSVAFVDQVSGKDIASSSQIYVTNDTGGYALFERCQNSLIAAMMDEESIDIDEDHGAYQGVFRNDTKKIIVQIYEGERVEDAIGYHLIMIAYRARV